MNDHTSKTLADRFSERRANGLVDIKFYVHNANSTAAKKVPHEAALLFEAIDAGKAQPFRFDDEPASMRG